MAYGRGDSVIGVFGGGDTRCKGGFNEVSESCRQPSVQKPLPAFLDRLLSMFDFAINPGTPVSSSYRDTTQCKGCEDDAGSVSTNSRRGKGGFGWKP
jgi:hypothetical protein